MSMKWAAHEGEGGTDRATIGVVALLLLGGLLMLYSASAPFSLLHYGSGHQMLARQAIAAAVGIAVAFALTRIDYRLLRHLSEVLLLGAFVLVVVTVLPVGSLADGRWLHLGPFDVQPTELLKFALIIYIACTIERKGDALRGFVPGVLPFVVVLGVIALVVLQQPDLGMLLVLGAITAVMLFLGGARVSHLGALFAAGIPCALLAVLLAPYRLARLIAFLSPAEFSTSSGYQALQSLVAVGSGGIVGRGLGASRAKLLYLPQAHSDFVFSVTAEELGLMGSVLLLGLFAALAWRSVCIARAASDPFGRLLALGIGFALLMQAAINVAVAVGLLPVTGLTLPFFSHGGSSLVVTLAMIGVLLSVSRHAGRRS
ncbi:MAG: putative lipid II flippase FtsW [Candidatus Bipolaricaulota bacterium]|nr:MAG: putative lipid II flippase FtsW [Candidatus Bipolaricaulota bacterium]